MGSRRKPARSLVPYGDRVEGGLLVRATIPVDLLDLLDLLFQVSLKPTPDAKAINRGLLPYVTRLTTLGPMRDGLDVDVAERQAHHVWSQLQLIPGVAGAVEGATGDDSEVSRALFDIVMRGLFVGTLVGSGGPEAIRRYFRRFNLGVRPGHPGARDASVQAARDRIAERVRLEGYGLGDAEATVAELASFLAMQAKGQDSAVGRDLVPSRPAAGLEHRSAAGDARPSENGGGLPARSERGACRANPLPDGVYGAGRVRRVVVDGVRYLCFVDVLLSLGYANPDRQLASLRRSPSLRGGSETVDVTLRTASGERDVVFLSELAALKLILRSHAAGRPGTPQHAFAMALVERAYGAGDVASLGDANEKRTATVERAFQISVARNARLLSENRECRRVAARGRKDVAAMQDDVLRTNDRARDWVTIGNEGKRDAGASRAALQEAERKLATAHSRIADLCGKVTGLQGELRSANARHAREIAVLKQALDHQSAIASTALQMFPAGMFAEFARKPRN